MSHPQTRQLIDYWRGLKTGGMAPLRAAVDPTRIPRLAPQLMMLGRPAAGRYRVRLAGELVVELYGRDLRDTDFLGLWRAEDRLAMSAALEAARREARAFLVRASAEAAGQPVQLEFAFAPLSAPTGGLERCLGFCQPLGPYASVRAPLAGALVLRDIRVAESGQPAAGLRLAAIDGRRVS